MKTVSATSFKAHCLALLREVETKRQTVIVTKHGKAVAKLISATEAPENADDIFGFFVGKGEIKGDLVSPALDLEEWGNLS